MLCTVSHLYCEDAMMRPIKTTEPGGKGAFFGGAFSPDANSVICAGITGECTAIRNGINSTMVIMMYNCR